MVKEKEEKNALVDEYSELYSDRSTILKNSQRVVSDKEHEIPVGKIDFLHDITMTLFVEFGYARMTLGEVLALTRGSIIRVNKYLGEAVSILAGGILVARGEVVIVNERLGVRITEVIRPQEKVLVDSKPELDF